MKPSDLSSLLTVAFEKNLKVLIKGAPGVGKTELVRAAARAAGCKLEIMHPAVSDPTDFKGLPARVGDHAEFLPYGQLRKLIEASVPTIAFIDDIGQAPHAVQAALMQLLQSREIDGHKISDLVTFCGATNDTTHMAGVHTILEPVKSRWDTIVDLEPDHIEWVRWAKGENLPETILAFVLMKGTPGLHDFKASRELTNTPSPRTVHAAAKLLSAGITRTDALAGAAGQGWATEFKAFLRVYKSLPDPQHCIDEPELAPIPDPKDVSTTFAIAVALSLRATKANFANVLTYLKRLPKEHEVLAVRDALARESDLQNAKAFTNWAVANVAVMA